MRYTVLFSIITTSLCMAPSNKNNTSTRIGQKVKRTVENLGYYAPPYFVKMPENDYQFSQSHLPPQPDPYSFSGYRSGYSAPFDIPSVASHSEDPTHSAEHLTFDGEDIDEDHSDYHAGGPSEDYQQKSAQVSHSQEGERVQTGYVYSDKPSYYPVVNSYENYCPKPAVPQPIIPSDLPMLRPDLPYPVIRDRVYTQKPENWNAILENFKKLSDQEGLVVDYLSAFPTAFDLLKKRLRERPVRPRTDRILMNVFEYVDPVREFSTGSEELNNRYRPRVNHAFNNLPLRRISNAGENPNYGSQYNYGSLPNPIGYNYGTPKELQSSDLRPYHLMGNFPKFKASIL